MTLIPFYNRVSGSGYAALHDPNSEFEKSYYPETWFMGTQV